MKRMEDIFEKSEKSQENLEKWTMVLVIVTLALLGATILLYVKPYG